MNNNHGHQCIFEALNAIIDEPTPGIQARLGELSPAFLAKLLNIKDKKTYAPPPIKREINKGTNSEAIKYIVAHIATASHQPSIQLSQKIFLT